MGNTDPFSIVHQYRCISNINQEDKMQQNIAFKGQANG